MNVTPLVDVVLVLLIIFMVIMPQMEKGIAVNLPGILNTEQTEQKLEPITLSLSKTGKLFIEKDLLDRQSFFEKLKALHDEKPERRIVLKADKDTRYDDVRELFKSCQELGFPGISLQVGDRNKRGEAPKDETAAAGEAAVDTAKGS